MRRVRNYSCYFSPCGGGVRVRYLDSKGEVKPCRELALVGAEFTGDELSKRVVESLPKCLRCAFRNFCGGGCPARAYSTFGTIMREDGACPAIRYMIPELIWKLYDNPALASGLGVSIS